MRLTSPAFHPNESMPIRFTGEGGDLSPPLVWTDAPVETKSFVLIVDDPDAPDPAAPKMTFVHWVLYHIPCALSSLPEKADVASLGCHQGMNDGGDLNYVGPLPPIGTHRYFHKLYALDAVLVFSKAPDKDVVLAAMEGHVLASAELVGVYRKQKS